MEGAGEEDKEGKTEAATEQKRSKAVEQGNVPVVKDTSIFSSALTFWIYCFVLFPLIAREIFPATLVFWAHADDISFETSGDILAILRQAAMILFLAAGPFLLIVSLATVGLTFLQNPPRLYPQRLAPKLDSLSVRKGAQRLFSLPALMEFGKSLLKLVAISVIALLVVRKFYFDMLLTSQMEPGALPGVYLAIVGKVVGYIVFALAIFHVAEMFLARFKWQRDLRMSRQELKEEFKHTEGDPVVRGRLRALAQSRARSRMMAAVPQATIILANPTHFAIALRYRREEGGAPLVVAKGQDYLALRIRSLAEENRVPVIENKPLARNLYYEVEVGKMIPSNFYRAVAEIIVAVNAARQKKQL